MCYMVTSIDDVRNLVAAARGLSGLVDLDALLGRAGRRMHALIGADLSAIAFFDGAGHLTLASVEGAVHRTTENPGHHSLGRRAFELDDTVTVELPDPSVDDPVVAVALDAGIRHLTACPVQFGGMPLGVLYTGTRGSVPDLRISSLLWEFAASLAPLMSNALRTRHAGDVAVQGERARIAHELHDTAGQLLFAISLAAQELREVGDDAEAIGRLTKRIEYDASEVSHRLREAMHGLLPPRDALAVAVCRDVDAFDARSRIAAEAVVLGTPVTTPDHVDEVVSAVVTEGLHNVERHSGASTVSVTLSYRPQGVAVMIQDDGRGLTEADVAPPTVVPGKTSGLGLPSLRRRVHALEGTFDLDDGEDGGTSLLVTLPLPEAS